MKTIIVNKKVIKVYDSIDEMPIVNFQKYNKFLLIDSGIGSDVDDIDSHIARIARFIKSKDSKKALQELQNMRQNMHMINSHISPKYLAFAAVIHSINNKPIVDLSDDNLKRVLDSIKEIKHSSIINFLAWLKKKVNFELETYFPNEFQSVKEKDSYDKLKNRTLLILDSIINDVDNSDKIQDIDDAILDNYKPKTFIGSESVEVKSDKQFENTCILISQETNMDAKKMTVLQFYSTIESMKQQADAKTKKLKQPKR